MTANEAKKKLKPPLKFGDADQIRLVRIVEMAETVKADRESMSEGCTECDGKGKVECDRCNGDGTHECVCGDEHECPECEGKGEVVCGDCLGGAEDPYTLDEKILLRLIGSLQAREGLRMIA